MRPPSWCFSLVICCSSLLLGSNSATAAKAPIAKLTQKEAERRGALIENVAYELDLNIDGTREHYDGTNNISFDLKSKADIFIDFGGGTVKALTVNNHKVKKISYDKIRIQIPKSHLKKGPNLISVRYEHPYSKNGSGFYRFQDPEDKRFYLYTDFEPFRANDLFPIFDQPDLKASYKLRVTAPSKWIVVTANRENKIIKKGDKKLWHFPETKRFSSYIFPLHAGEYKVWESKAGKIPLRLMARQSLAKYVRPKDWFTVTRQGFEYFQTYFQSSYPFGKYDQVIVPDFNWGAMENVGAVTFTESWVKRSTPTRKNRETLAEVILHEMAHMWFGNLVTMRWWDDLWLNESFATYMAVKASAEATKFKEAWQTFYQGSKQWAYWEDSLVTNHPIVAKVPDTAAAFSNFDGITYGKGAAALKQLVFLIGEENFRKGMRHYFKKYAYQNTTLKDFLASLSTATKHDLGSWSRQWLESAGTNRVGVDFSCDDKRISRFRLTQEAPKSNPDLRPHRSRVALYRFPRPFDKSRPPQPKEFFTSDVFYSGASTEIKELKGKACPDLVNPNKDDFDFAKTKLDEASLTTVFRALEKIENPLDRMQMWSALWDMVREQDLHVLSYNYIALSKLQRETDINIIRQVLRTVSREKRASVFHYYPKEATKQKADSIAFWEEELWKRFESAASTDEKKLWFDSFVELAASDSGRARLRAMLAGKQKLRKFKLDQDRRWALVIELASFEKGKLELIASEKKRDSSERGRKSALAAEAAIGSLANKQKWFKEITDIEDRSKLTLAQKKTIMKNLFPLNQEALHKRFTDSIYNAIPQLAKSKDENYMESFVPALLPSFCDQPSIKRLRQFIKVHKDLPSYVSKPLRVGLQEEERCLAARKTASKYLRKKGA